MKISASPSCSSLRRALRSNIVSFPSQVPPLLEDFDAGVQSRMVLLYFVRGWGSAAIASRFQLPNHRIWKALNEWSCRALALGFVQIIDRDAFAVCCRMTMESGEFGEGGPLLVEHQQPARSERIAPEASSKPAAELSAALDVAISHCQAWRGEFWVRLATVLTELKGAAVAASHPALASDLQQERAVSDKRRTGHAVA